ncbi:hypothetical protein L1987_21636 [Smallanthus sonchifolius]|uniref:Uncharacterized protein n=1 Tax=Smallanthus sonchifolius TaxID=185202 RepID=A0ACB9IE54_9ASTR|nr:hypothetical protein L1987_21636 [Smallanthus sonchifolius]
MLIAIQAIQGMKDHARIVVSNLHKNIKKLFSERLALKGQPLTWYKEIFLLCSNYQRLWVPFTFAVEGSSCSATPMTLGGASISLTYIASERIIRGRKHENSSLYDKTEEHMIWYLLFSLHLHSYQGNPYLSPGCKDINECSDVNKFPCYGKCVNTIGNYTCKCKEGYSGDAKVKDGCQRKPSNVLRLSLGLGLGFLTLLIGLPVPSMKEVANELETLWKSGKHHPWISQENYTEASSLMIESEEHDVPLVANSDTFGEYNNSIDGVLVMPSLAIKKCRLCKVWKCLFRHLRDLSLNVAQKLFFGVDSHRHLCFRIRFALRSFLVEIRVFSRLSRFLAVGETEVEVEVVMMVNFTSLIGLQQK